MLTYPLEKDNSWERCRWESHERQYKRFKCLCEIGELNDRSILDVGCGDGELYVYLQLNPYFRVRYAGIDHNPYMIGFAQCRIFDPKISLRCMDIEDFLNRGEYYDYIFMSGVFNAEEPGIEDRVKIYLPKLFEKAKLGVAVNFLNEEYPHRHPDFHMWPPRKMAHWALTFCDNVQIRKDYLDNDFTMYLRK